MSGITNNLEGKVLPMRDNSVDLQKRNTEIEVQLPTRAQKEDSSLLDEETAQQERKD